MKLKALCTVTVLLLCVGSLVANHPVFPVHGMLPTNGAESPAVVDNPPPIDSICLVFAGVDYGGGFSSPQNYVNAKHITNVSVGSYYFPVVVWEMGGSWSDQSLFSYWDDMFKFWSYPDSFTTNQGIDTGRGNVCADSHGNLHFCWHQTGSPDGYEIFYTRADLDTSAGVIQYNVNRTPIMLSSTNGEEEHFPAMAIYEDTLLMAVWGLGADEHALGYNYSIDGGYTWLGPFVAYEHGSVMPGSWQLPSIGPDPNTGDMWVAFNFDMSGDGSMDIVAFHWDASTNTWTYETAATAISMHPYACPAIVVDYNSVPHIIFQENLSTTGGSGGLSGWNGCGPAGTLHYIHRIGANNWSVPSKIIFPGIYTARSYCAGYPSAGIAANDNGIYFSTTLPESASSDTGAYLPFNVHWAEISGYGEISYGGKVSNLPWADTTNAIYAHTTYNVEPDGPGITWCQMVNAVPPADVYYNHKDTLAGIVEDEADLPSKVALYQNAPNPFSNKTVIRFSTGQRTEGSLTIYDVAGRKVREWHLAPSHTSLVTGLVWDGKDMNGQEVPGGIYLYTLTSGSFAETKKLILVR